MVATLVLKCFARETLENFIFGGGLSGFGMGVRGKRMMSPQFSSLELLDTHLAK